MPTVHSARTMPSPVRRSTAVPAGAIVYVDVKDKKTWPHATIGSRILTWFANDPHRPVTRDAQLIIDFIKEGDHIAAWAPIEPLDAGRLKERRQVAERETRRRYSTRPGKNGHDVLEQSAAGSRVIATSPKPGLGRLIANALNLMSSR